MLGPEIGHKAAFHTLIGRKAKATFYIFPEAAFGDLNAENRRGRSPMPDTAGERTETWEGPQFFTAHWDVKPRANVVKETSGRTTSSNRCSREYGVKIASEAENSCAQHH